ncbi:hypothetical protein SDC9_133854 [bioreactor metagenome]|uniref:YopX protein domain-containing protein n=1 Tax=bioreactor metagenome TaxID=1076179 RepID=A0A645DDW7_9ZZZZ|nr:YopX family protein [Enterococcus thailandicus]
MIPKFRAYSTEENEMYYPHNDKNVDWTMDDETGFIAPLVNLGSGMWGMIDKYELMQSTGLKDKNDVEIFEGDIVRVFEYGRYGGTYNAPVSWISYSNEGEQWAFHGFTCIGVKEIEHHSEVESLFTRGFLTRQFGSCVQLSELTKDPRNSIKVIGNIYENPELLEAE